MNTRSKRASSVNFLKPYALALVLPDGTLNLADRQHSVWDYSGISSAIASATVFLEGVVFGPGGEGFMVGPGQDGTIFGPGLEGVVRM